MSTQTRIIEVRQNVLKQNDILARALRQRFHEAGVFVVSMVSSPGAGKTALLERTLTLLRQQFRVAALVGDLATENDAARLARSQAPVKQILTGTVCHLEAAMVQNALEGWKLDDLDFLFIENVGNLVCPASFDLGQHLNITLLSVTEGDDKPAKYPVIFRASDLVLLSKADLLDVLNDFSPARAEAALRALGRDTPMIRTAARRVPSIGVWLHWLEQELMGRRQAQSPQPRLAVGMRA